MVPQGCRRERKRAEGCRNGEAVEEKVMDARDPPILLGRSTSSTQAKELA